MLQTFGHTIQTEPCFLFPYQGGRQKQTLLVGCYQNHEGIILLFGYTNL